MDELEVSLDRVLTYLGAEYVHRMELEAQVAKIEAENTQLKKGLEALKEAAKKATR